MGLGFEGHRGGGDRARERNRQDVPHACLAVLLESRYREAIIPDDQVLSAVSTARATMNPLAES